MGPERMVKRKSSREVELDGLTGSDGTILAPLVSSANHDDAMFENPEVFDIRRKIPRILSMGSGVHQCIGQMLARLEARIALEEWVARVSALTLSGEPESLTAIGLRGFATLPVAFGRPTASPAARPP